MTNGERLLNSGVKGRWRMATLVFPISEGYVRSWGVWEMVREIVQNGLDEDDLGRKLQVTHDGTWLHVNNSGADMDGQAMLLGHSDKGPDQRGRHGEGLNLAMLVAARMQLDMVIETKTEKWVPYIGMSTEFSGRVLCVKTQKLRKLRDGVTVSVKVPAEEWERIFRHRFLKFSTFKEGEILTSWRGSIIFREDLAGQIFVKGIYVMTDSKLRNGFDFNEAELDRDRSMMSSWDLSWAVGCVWESVMQQVKDLAPKAFQLAMADAPELDGFQHMTGIRTAVTKQFCSAYGEKAVPVLSVEEAAKVEAAGFRGVTVPARMRKMLIECGAPTVEAVAKGHGKQIKRRYDLDELNDAQTAMLDKIKDVLTTAARRVSDVPEACRQYGIREGWAEFSWPRVCVSEFNDDNIMALWEGVDGEGIIHFSPVTLGSFRVALRYAVHEVAHHVSESADGAVSHTRAIEELWSLLYHTKGE